MDLDTVVMVPFVLVQASVVMFVWLHGKKEKTFRQAFYVFFMTGTTADCLYFVLVSEWTSSKHHLRATGSEPAGPGSF